VDARNLNGSAPTETASMQDNNAMELNSAAMAQMNHKNLVAINLSATTMLKCVVAILQVNWLVKTEKNAS
jgi:hypothetical protein